MLQIDGSMGEGGGQILRSALSLSLLTQTPFRISKIRAGRKRPGLLRQHFVCVEAAREIGDAEVAGAEMGSTEIVFRPRTLRGGAHTFAIGGAGSTSLVFQTVLLPLLLGASSASTLRFEGGTHNPMAPPVDFLQASFLAQLARMGAKVELSFERHGFYPAGGGAWSAIIHPLEALGRLDLLERGAILARRAVAIVSQVPPRVALRELETLTAALDWPRDCGRPLMVPEPRGPGNVLLATVESEHVTEVFIGFGERGVRAEEVARGVATEVTRYLRAEVPVFEHLADQLLLPMALGAGGAFRTVRPTDHARTHATLVETFLGVKIAFHEEGEDVFRIEVEPGPTLVRNWQSCGS
jgi:RNA 3'-terminal phosphate cyclase (ATP)